MFINELDEYDDLHAKKSAMFSLPYKNFLGRLGIEMRGRKIDENQLDANAVVD